MNTITGRTPSQPEMQDLRPLISNPKVLIVRGGDDFAQLEMRVLAALADDSVSTIHIDFETRQSDPFDFVFGPASDQLRLYACYDYTPTPKYALTDGPAVKQNGRSAAYLKHDRTKRHRR